MPASLPAGTNDRVDVGTLDPCHPNPAIVRSRAAARNLPFLAGWSRLPIHGRQIE